MFLCRIAELPSAFVTVGRSTSRHSFVAESRPVTRIFATSRRFRHNSACEIRTCTVCVAIRRVKTQLPTVESSLASSECAIPCLESAIPPLESAIPAVESALTPREFAIPAVESALIPVEFTVGSLESALAPVESPVDAVESPCPLLHRPV
jgi:hypothetical protein